MQLPFRTGSVDICFSSNVLEHVPQPWTMADEMVRVTRPGGIVFLSYTTWLSPHGGHETSPWHYLGRPTGARPLPERVHGKPPKNVYGESMYAVYVHEALRWARAPGKRRLGRARRGLPALSPALGVPGGAHAGRARDPHLESGPGAA